MQAQQSSSSQIIQSTISKIEENYLEIGTDFHDNFISVKYLTKDNINKESRLVTGKQSMMKGILGGSHDEKGMRNGIWIDLDENFDRNLQSSIYSYIQIYEDGLKKEKMITKQFI